jgi:hypothetical protein
MLQRYSAKVQGLLDKVALARDNAERAILPEDKQFWRAMEERWLALVQSTEHVDRTTTTSPAAMRLGKQEVGKRETA